MATPDAIEVICKAERHYYDRDEFEDMAAGPGVIVRCRDCRELVEPGTEVLAANPAQSASCLRFSVWHSDDDWMSWYRVEPGDYCSWGMRREDANERDA